jgi:outer membrane lipoprotein-sorting protein
MFKFNVITAVVILMFSVMNTLYSGEMPAGDILRKSAEKYKSLKTYSDTGSVRSEVVYNGSRISVDISFKILMKKPDLYLITWSQKSSMIPVPQKSAVWNDGQQAYLYISTMRAFSKLPNAKFGLASSAGISDGITNFIPSLFFEFFYKSDSFIKKLKKPKVSGTEFLDGDECYVITASASFTKKITLWISKSTFLIRKSSKEIAGSEKKSKDSDIKKEKRGLFNLAERRKSADSNSEDLNGSVLEIHNNISFPELEKQSFKFKMPEGTVLKQSLLMH